jgi:tripartite-type tricarboxylate transporter receptor subunit TctC
MKCGWRGLVAVLCAVLFAPLALADTYPARPIRLIVGFAVGSAGDTSARVIADGMSRFLGQPVIVENKPGASSNIAADYVAHSAKDGYTLLLGTVANATEMAITPNLQYDLMKDFEPVGLAATVPVLLVVHPSLGVHNLDELIALAKKRPGQITYASTGIGTTPHLAGELLNERAGIQMVHVPYQGSGQAIMDLIADQTQVMFASASTALPQVKSGALVALAAATPHRVNGAPDVPTTGELGWPELDASIWLGIVTPAGTPEDINAKLSGALAAAMQAEDVRDRLQKQGFEVSYMPPAEFSKYIVREVKKWTDVAKIAKVAK